MPKYKEDILAIMKIEFPEIFNKNGTISIELLSNSLKALSEKDEQNNFVFNRIVLIEKRGNIIGEKFRLLKLMNKLHF